MDDLLIERLTETIRAFGRGDIVPITDKDAEIERLTAALEDIADHGDMYSGPGLAAIAKLALEQKADR